MYPRRRFYGPRRLGWRWRRPIWRRRPGCWWLFALPFGALMLLALAAFRLF